MLGLFSDTRLLFQPSASRERIRVLRWLDDPQVSQLDVRRSIMEPISDK